MISWLHGQRCWDSFFFAMACNITSCWLYPPSVCFSLALHPHTNVPVVRHFWFNQFKFIITRAQIFSVFVFFFLLWRRPELRKTVLDGSGEFSCRYIITQEGALLSTVMSAGIIKKNRKSHDLFWLLVKGKVKEKLYPPRVFGRVIAVRLPRRIYICV